MNKKIIYLFGNHLLDIDSLPFLLGKKLKNSFPDIAFIEFDPNENLKPIDLKLSLIDTIEGLTKVTTITNLNKLKLESICSMHDFDLGYNIKLLEKIGKLKQITIFGIPINSNPNESLKQLKIEIDKNYERI